jgi:hypothetical protein
MKQLACRIKTFAAFGVMAGLLYASLGAMTNRSGDGTAPGNQRQGSLSKTGAAPDAYAFWINNIIMPVSSDGVLADVAIGDVTSGAYQSPGATVLYSGGFFLSGYSGTTLWANAVASASRVTDYLPGSCTLGGNGGIYVIDKNDPAFGESWQTWKEAVAMGADFWDGDNDGVYDPVDKNGNGIWDNDEDSPDILGDQTAWFVINDGVLANRRRWVVEPQGVDLQQTIFGFRSAGSIGNMLFIRYRIINRGLKADVMDSVYFGIWADADIGGTTAYDDDVVGCDTTLNAGFTYNDGPDNFFGVEAPCFLISFFQGPIVETGNPADTAIDVRGQVFGKSLIAGAKNLGLSSFVNYVQSDALRGDPDTYIEARNYNTGRLRKGEILDPCNDPYGRVDGLPCDQVPKTFWYSGDPVTDYGWLYNVPSDMRQMQNIGPFRLEKDKPVDVVAAYVVGRGTDAKNSVTVARTIARLSKQVYDGNFEGAPGPPLVQPDIRTTDNTIELIWDTAPQLTFNAQSSVFDYDLRFEGYEVTMYNTNTTADVAGGRTNSKVIARYDVQNAYGDILGENPSTGERTVLYQKGTQLDSATYAKQGSGRIRLVVDSDPFTGGELLKGKPYFFSITGHAVNTHALIQLNPSKDIYIISGGATVGYTANSASILNTSSGGIRPGIDFNTPYMIEQPQVKSAGAAEGTVTLDELDKSQVTGHEYEVSFFKNQASPLFQMYWRVKDLTTGQVVLDSVLENYRPAVNGPSFAFPSFDGLMVRVAGVDPQLKTPTYSGTQWYSTFDDLDATGAFYLGSDLGAVPRPADFSTANTRTAFDKLRRVEVRFGPTQKAYRYVKSSAIGANYLYAAGMPTTSGLDTTANFGKGYVDVPFQVWVKDERTQEEYQLNCGFLETAYPRTRLNGAWDPGTKVLESKEFIVVFDTKYQTDTLLQYTGGTFNSFTRWANILSGWQFPTQWDTTLMTADQRESARDRYLGAMLVVGFQRKDSVSFPASGDILAAPISYPFLPSDVYRFQTQAGGQTITGEARKEVFSKVNVYPNPLFGFNPTGSYLGARPDEPFVTFTNLPEAVTIKIYNIAGTLLRTLTESDKALGPSSPFLEWNLKNESGLRVASGMYLAIVSSPGIGEKVLKLAIIMPQKQIDQY